MTTHPSIETAISLLKELRDTTPITAQRKRIDAFLAMGEFGQPESGHGTPNLCDGIQSAHNVESATVSNPSPANSPHPPIYKTSIEEHDAWFDATFQKDFVFKDGCYSWTLAGWKAAIAAMGDATTRKDDAVSACARPQSDPSEICLKTLSYGECLKLVMEWCNQGASWNLQPSDRLKNVAFHLHKYLDKRLPEPVPVSLEKCAIAASHWYKGRRYEHPQWNTIGPVGKQGYRDQVKLILDAVGVPYVD